MDESEDKEEEKPKPGKATKKKDAAKKDKPKTVKGKGKKERMMSRMVIPTQPQAASSAELTRQHRRSRRRLMMMTKKSSRRRDSRRQEMMMRRRWMKAMRIKRWMKAMRIRRWMKAMRKLRKSPGRKEDGRSRQGLLFIFCHVVRLRSTEIHQCTSPNSLTISEFSDYFIGTNMFSQSSLFCQGDLMRNDYNQFIKDTMKTVRDENPGLTGREVLRTARAMRWAQLTM